MNLQVVQRSKGNAWALWVLESVFLLNEGWIRSYSLRNVLWSLIKIELFYVGGRCQHSGHCCQRLSIFRRGRPIQSRLEWQSYVSENPKQLSRFEPVINPQMGESRSIRYFNCNCLTTENRCSQYESRPQFCRMYPFSNFVSEVPLADPCGYYVGRTQLRLRSSNRRLLRLVKRMCLIYHLS